MAQQLNDAGDEVYGNQTELIEVDKAWEYTLVEAPWMIYHDGLYYLFYSGGMYNQPTYNVGVAVASSPLGPFTKACAPILSQYADNSASNEFCGPGHASILDCIGYDCSTFIIYHSWLSGAVNSDPGRVVLVDRIWWVDGWPVVGSSGTPTSTEQPTPTTEEAASRQPDMRLVANSSHWTLTTYQWDDHCWDDDGTITNCSFQYIVHEGNCPGATVSLESVDKPGMYFRHCNGKLRLDYDDGSDLFKQDSSFMPLAGLEAAEYVSFRSINYPEDYVRHENGNLLITEWDESDQMGQDGTFRQSAN